MRRTRAADVVDSTVTTETTRPEARRWFVIVSAAALVCVAAVAVVMTAEGKAGGTGNPYVQIGRAHV